MFNADASSLFDEGKMIKKSSVNILPVVLALEMERIILNYWLTKQWSLYHSQIISANARYEMVARISGTRRQYYHKCKLMCFACISFYRKKLIVQALMSNEYCRPVLWLRVILCLMKVG